MVTTSGGRVCCQIQTKQSSAWVRRARARDDNARSSMSMNDGQKFQEVGLKDRFEIGLRKVVQRGRYVAERSVGHHMREKQFGVL
jgi:hypothetical protein